jgi:uncharacterized protein
MGVPDLPVLDPVELRVLGALLEKQRTVPDSYPLSLNALRTACNQTTSRDPVASYDEGTIVDALGRLRDRELVRFVKPTGLRVVKYHQRLEERLELDEERAALLTVLMLRGPQTPGELLPRVERILVFADRESVEEVLREMAALDPPLVRELPRQPGQRDRRWTQLMGVVEAEAPATSPPVDREVVLAAGPVARDRKVAAEYDRLAESYAIALGDDLDAKPFDRWLLDRLASEATKDPAGHEQSPPAQGLDVGCGPGQVAGYLANRGVAMTGLDISASMVAQAQELQPAVQVVQGSFVVPPMPRGADPRDPGWAVITAWYGFSHLAPSELTPVLNALVRTLRRGGALGFAVHTGAEIQHPGQLWDVATDLDFVLHDPEVVLAAATSAGLVNLEWYLRGPLPQEAQTSRLYVIGDRSG